MDYNLKRYPRLHSNYLPLLALIFQGEHPTIQIEDHRNKLKELEHTFMQIPPRQIVPVRELITAAHLEENAIVLTYAPQPDSVHLFITSMVYIPETSRGVVLRGRKIFLEDIPGDVHLATNLREWVTERAVAVE